MFHLRYLLIVHVSGSLLEHLLKREKPIFDFVSHKGYLYVANKLDSNKMYYNCYYYKEETCRATAQIPTDNKNYIKLGKMEHTHPPNPCVSIICRFKNRLKRRACFTNEPVDVVYRQTAEEDPLGAMYVPRTKNLFVAMGHWRHRYLKKLS